MKKIILFSLPLLLLGCDKVSKITGNAAKCDSEISQKLIKESFVKSLNDSANTRIKEVINTENITVDMGKLRSALNQLNYSVTNIRTNNSDPNSKKEYCVTEFIVKVPDSMVKDADAIRTHYNQNKVAESAITQDLSFEQNQIKVDLDYIVQPTDNGEKVYVTLENPDSLVYFVRDITVDALLKSPRENALKVAHIEQEKREMEQAEAAQEYQAFQLDEANSLLNKANDDLNIVWNSTTQDVRNNLLDEQKTWLKRRKLECKLQGSNAETGAEEITRLNCEIEMTTQRTAELRNRIMYLE